MPLFNYLFDLVSRWTNNAPLKPAERAAFRFGEGVIFTILGTIISAVVSLVTKNPHAPLGDVAGTAEGAAISAVLYTIWHYLSSVKDPKLLQVVENPDIPGNYLPAESLPLPTLPAPAASSAPVETAPVTEVPAAAPEVPPVKAAPAITEAVVEPVPPAPSHGADTTEVPAVSAAVASTPAEEHSAH